MANSDNAIGLKPVDHITGGAFESYFRPFKIADGYTTDLFIHDPVALSSGYIVRGVAGSPVVGTFEGVEYTDASGRFVVSPYWPAGATYADDGKMQVYFTSDPQILYDGQCDGSVAASKIGEGINLADTSEGSAYTGLSTQALSATTTGATPGLGTVVGIPQGVYYGGEENLPGDAYTIVRVRLTPQVPIA